MRTKLLRKLRKLRKIARKSCNISIYKPVHGDVGCIVSSREYPSLYETGSIKDAPDMKDEIVREIIIRKVADMRIIQLLKEK